MLHKIKINNFQCHRELEVELSTTVTTFVGKTDSGKSTILRALIWICLNEHPKNFISWGASHVSAKLKIDGHVVTRYQGNGRNYYRIDGNNFEAVGGNVPDSISELLQVTDINFQRQLDSPFWLSQTAGTVSREMNQIVNLSVIDTTMSAVTSRLRRTNTEIEIAKARLQTAEAALTALDWVPVLAEETTVLESMQKESLLAASRASNLNITVKSITLMLQTRENAISLAYLAKQAVAAGDVLTEVKEKLSRLKWLVGQIEQQKKAMEEIPDYSEMESIIEKWAPISERRVRLRDLLEEIENAEYNVCQVSDTAKSAIEEIQKKTGGLCPVCSRPLKM